MTFVCWLSLDRRDDIITFIFLDNNHAERENSIAVQVNQTTHHRWVFTVTCNGLTYCLFIHYHCASSRKKNIKTYVCMVLQLFVMIVVACAWNKKKSEIVIELLMIKLHYSWHAIFWEFFIFNYRADNSIQLEWLSLTNFHLLLSPENLTQSYHKSYSLFLYVIAMVLSLRLDSWQNKIRSRKCERKREWKRRKRNEWMAYESFKVALILNFINKAQLIRVCLCVFSAC